MPYIHNKVNRARLDKIVDDFSSMNDVGHLNYFLFKLAKKDCFGYQGYRDFFGEIESSKLEIYRRLVAPYEDKKIEENGDVK